MELKRKAVLLEWDIEDRIVLFTWHLWSFPNVYVRDDGQAYSPFLKMVDAQMDGHFAVNRVTTINELSQ